MKESPISDPQHWATAAWAAPCRSCAVRTP